jgi:hypothetical protein
MSFAMTKQIMLTASVSPEISKRLVLLGGTKAAVDEYGKRNISCLVRRVLEAGLAVIEAQAEAPTT